MIRLLLIIVLGFPALLHAQLDKESIQIGVLSHRGDEITHRNWSYITEYLNSQIPESHFTIVPLDFEEIEPAVRAKQIHFLLVNPSIYVNMEVRHRISRITTLKRHIADAYYDVFAGVIFTRSNRNDINGYSDIGDKSLVAVKETSLGGYQMALREFIEAGIDPEADFSRISFAGIHDQVVRDVLDGKADVGTVRTGILESMSKKQPDILRDIKVIGERKNDDFAQIHSTRLYPEWPFSKLRHTSKQLAKRVAIELMSMSHVADNKPEWSIPLEYGPVHKLLQVLKFPPYDVIGQFTLKDAIQKYWYLIVTTSIYILLLSIMMILIVRLNRALNISKKRLEQQHDLILDSVADGIYGVDLEGNSTFVNRAMERITGWKASEVIGKNQHQILHHTRESGEPHPAEECPVYKTSIDNKPRTIDEDIFWKQDGSSFPVEYSCTPLLDDSNKTLGSVVVFRDISERKQAEEQARQHREEMQHLSRIGTMGEMASGMAHELKQPLTAIATNADACMRMTESNQINTEGVQDVLDIISKQAKRAGGVIQQLRNFIRKELPEKSPNNLNILVNEAVLLVKHDLTLNAIKLTLDQDKQLPDIYVQHIQIVQVILNLIKNAIEAIIMADASNKSLHISTSCHEDLAVLRVQDSGTGISQEIQRTLFTPFITSKQEGMGLGLSISQGIVSEHGGKIILEHTSDEGSTFCLMIPTIRHVENGRT